jgi:hypothetical protein
MVSPACPETCTPASPETAPGGSRTRHEPRRDRLTIPALSGAQNAALSGAQNGSERCSPLGLVGVDHAGVDSVHDQAGDALGDRVGPLGRVVEHNGRAGDRLAQ